MKHIFFYCLCLSLTTQAQSLSGLTANQIKLPNGWKLSPVGNSLPLGDLPLNITVSKSGKYIAVTNNGQSEQSIQLIDAKSGTVSDNVPIGKSWLGIGFSSDDKKLFASGGNDNIVIGYSIGKGKLNIVDTFTLGKPLPNKISPTGLTLDEVRNILYVCTKEDSSLYLFNLSNHQLVKRIFLGAEAFTCLLSPDKQKLYISAWGGGKVLMLNCKTQRIEDSIAVGSNPNDMCLNHNGNILYVTNANDNSVSVVDTKKWMVLETLNAALYPDAPTGSTTNGVALSKDGKTLFVANADNNCLAVFDVSKVGNSTSKGFIPTGWYPTCVRTYGNKLYVANGKGYTSLPNPSGPNPMNKKIKLGYQKGDTTHQTKVLYIGGLFKGTLETIDIPNDALLSTYTQAVFQNTPYNKAKETTSEGEANNPIPMKIGSPSPIKHIFYIIKENRTYDQVLGDIPEGNGDKKLCLFGEKITPNQHALAKQFVLLDNFYCDGEVSADGHNWSLGGYANDYLEKTWPTSYGGRGGGYDAEGNRAIANNKKGFIWDFAQRAGISFRTYGEFADDYKPNIPVLKGHFCPYYTSWDPKVRDTTRVNQWKRDFDSLLSINALPQINTLRLINDHTEGLRKGRPTPYAHVADNDLAVGMFIDYLSHSIVWNESVVFIVEDDAQDGPDHVDAHRTTAYLAGGFVKRGFIDHTPYSTSSMLRTIELIFGMPPMSQYDAAATPLWRSFASSPNPEPFTVKGLQVNIDEKNTVSNFWQRKSERFDFSKEDLVPDREFTEVIWKAVRGEFAVVPAPVRAAFFKGDGGDKD